MNKKNSLLKISILAFFSLLLVFSLPLYSQGKKEAKDEQLLDSIKKEKGPVLLKHKAHIEKYGAKCIDCHHTSKTEKEEIKACKDCHEADKEKEKAPKLKMAYHKLCQGCHKKAVEAKKAKGEKYDHIPAMKCELCHQKK